MNPLFISIKRELRHAAMRPRYLLLVTIGIAFSYLFFLTLMAEGQPEKLPIAIVDHDGSYLSRRLCHEIEATQGVEVAAVYDNQQQARRAMQRQEVFAFLEIPEGAYREVVSFRRPHLSLYANNAFLLGGSFSYKTLATISKLASGAVQREVLRKKGLDEQQIAGMIQPIELDAHFLSNATANYQPYVLTTILPGILGLMVLLYSIFVCWTEYETGTADQWVAAAGGSWMAAVWGKLLPYTVWFSLLNIGGCLILFGPCRYTLLGNFWILVVTTVLFVLALQSMAVLLVGLIPQMHLSMCVGAIYGTLAFTMSGFSFPVTSMPAPLQSFSLIFPLRHYYLTYVDVAMYGSGMECCWPHIAMLLLFLLAGFVGLMLVSKHHSSGLMAASFLEPDRCGGQPNLPTPPAAV